MLISTLNQAIQPTSEKLPDGLQYFLLFLLFAFIIVAIIVVIYFSKWLTLGPKVKRRWGRITRKGKSEKVVNGVQVRGGEIVVDANYEQELRNKITNSNSPQEKLDYQVKLEEHLKEKEKAANEIKKAEEAKLAKIQEKEERARITREAKEEAKRLKEESKGVKK